MEDVALVLYALATTQTQTGDCRLASLGLVSLNLLLLFFCWLLLLLLSSSPRGHKTGLRILLRSSSVSMREG